MTYYLLGTGRMAQFVANRLAGKHHCLGIYSRSKNEVAQQLSRLLDAPVFNQPEALSGTADAYLLAVSDDAIEQVAQRLTVQNGTVIHFSGTVPLEVLRPHPQRAVCWPFYSIGPGIAPEKILPAVGEGNNEEARDLLSTLATALSFQFFEAPEEARRQMHLTAVIGNNFVNHLLCICEQICRKAALPSELLQPILKQTFERAAAGDPCLSQTGPARRGDVATQAAHLTLLAQHPEWQRLYKAISDSIAALYPPQ